MIESLAFLEFGERLTRSLSNQAMAAELPPAAYGSENHKELTARIGSSREVVFKIPQVLAAKAIVKESNVNILIALNALECLKSAKRM